MADIASAISKMNDLEISVDAPLSEAVNTKYGANINGLIDRLSLTEVVLTGSGNWTVPANVTRVLLLGWGGGGSGDAQSGGGIALTAGGQGAPMGIFNLATTPANLIAYAVGAGGAQASVGAGAGFATGNPGINSTFGSIVFRGAFVQATKVAAGVTALSGVSATLETLREGNSGGAFPGASSPNYIRALGTNGPWQCGGSGPGGVGAEYPGSTAVGVAGAAASGAGGSAGHHATNATTSGAGGSGSIIILY